MLPHSPVEERLQGSTSRTSGEQASRIPVQRHGAAAARGRRNGRATASGGPGLSSQRRAPPRRPLDLDQRKISDFPGAASFMFSIAELRRRRSSSLTERSRYRAAQVSLVKNEASQREGEPRSGFSADAGDAETHDEVPQFRFQHAGHLRRVAVEPVRRPLTAPLLAAPVFITPKSPRLAPCARESTPCSGSMVSVNSTRQEKHR